MASTGTKCPTCDGTRGQHKKWCSTLDTAKDHCCEDWQDEGHDESFHKRSLALAEIIREVETDTSRFGRTHWETCHEEHILCRIHRTAVKALNS